MRAALLLALMVVGALHLDQQPAEAARVRPYPMIFPVIGDAYYFYQSFGACRGPDCERRHMGVDIVTPKLTPVVSVADGTVLWTHEDLGTECCGLAIEHDDGWFSLYLHLNNDTPLTDDGLSYGIVPGVEKGTRVEAGQLIGWSGDSTNAEFTPPHLHFELHRPRKGYDTGWPVDPYVHLRAAPMLTSPTQKHFLNGCDFDGNGGVDLAVGEAGIEVDGMAHSGALSIFYRSAQSMVARRTSPLYLADLIGGDATASHFGAAIACGDLDGDGFDDLVIGAPGHRVGEVRRVGVVVVLYGSSVGLEQRRITALSSPDADWFGTDLAINDFDRDGFADLAVGLPRHDGDEINTGAVWVYSGSAAGVDPNPAMVLGPLAGAVADYRFGTSLVARDFDGDGFGDLTVGMAGTEAAGGPGGWFAYRGSATGLMVAGDDAT